MAAGASKAGFCPLTDKITTAASTTLESSGQALAQGHVGRDGKFYLFLSSWKSTIISNYLENIKSCFKSFGQFRLLTWFGAYLLKYVIPAPTPRKLTDTLSTLSKFGVRWIPSIPSITDTKGNVCVKV